MPGASPWGFQRIESESERERLKKVVSAYCDEQGGFIIRTAAEGVSEDLASDAAYLKRVWTKVMERKNATRPAISCTVSWRLPSASCVILLMLSSTESAWTRASPTKRCWNLPLSTFRKCGLLEHYTGRQPIFDLYDVENEIQRALERKVELKSGGYLIIDQTEAMTTVDINTGAFVGHRNWMTLSSIPTLKRHRPLRASFVCAPGGIIIIDFIDMNNEDHRRRVLHSLEQALSKDRVKPALTASHSWGWWK